jgi:MFS family permease
MTAHPTPLTLSTWRGRRILALLCAVAFLDFIDASITNVALPHIRTALGFSLQRLQWVPSAYMLTYGGLMLLGGRLADEAQHPEPLTDQPQPAVSDLPPRRSTT